MGEHQLKEPLQPLISLGLTLKLGDLFPILFPRFNFARVLFTQYLCSFSGNSVPRRGIINSNSILVRETYKMTTSAPLLISSDNPDKRLYQHKVGNENTFVIGEIVLKQSERI